MAGDELRAGAAVHPITAAQSELSRAGAGRREPGAVRVVLSDDQMSRLGRAFGATGNNGAAGRVPLDLRKSGIIPVESTENQERPR